MDHNEFLKVSFKEAVKFEESGREFFLKAAAETKNPMARDIFTNLADEELKHIRRIKEIFESLVRKNELPAVLPASDNLPWKNIFREAMDRFKELVKQTTMDTEAIQLSLDFEAKGYKLYQGLADKSVSPIEKKFFETLRDEEEGHYLMIENLQKFLENPIDWYGEEEHHIFEG